MKKLRFISFVLIFVILFPFSSVALAEGGKSEENHNPLDPECRSAILIEPVSGKVIFEKNSNEKYPPASVTKVMTMLLAMEAVDSGKIKLDDKITCSEKVKSMGGSSMLLDNNEVRTVEEIIKGIGIASGNDAAVAMAEYLAGSEDAFVLMMNKRAKELGMNNTSFQNCTGLSAPNHYTTASDIAKMSMELLKHPQILKYTGTYMETISEGRKTPIELVNHNKLVRFFKGCDGLKTGFTSEAMYCISATAVRDNVRMLTVIMGAPSFKVRNRDASNLMNYGFSKFECKKLVEKDAEVQRVDLDKNGEKFYLLKSVDDVKAIVERGEEFKLDQKITVDEKKKCAKAGEIIGTCEFYNGSNLIGKVDLYCDRDISRGSIFENFKDYIKNLFNCAV
ncbi:D-alanyl-D-alanine carboxypeptidase family protein [uncultured Clostridium sp.]|uniref:D-alanyl-D-alanine carboxypeptidase family protein n=1 Tax=uncultured Clostridium sp. TaxID=59620 RepID=UPI0025FBBBF2|nr:D-alanyl-D-alanine carboxypeptidase family protein [uncultured Clostridium sp.]